MARDYDTQLLESVAVRRRRLRDAILFGPQRARRTFDENVMKIVAGICVAAVCCAGTVGWSFLQSMLSRQERERAQQSQVAPEGGSASVPADWVGSQITFPRLRTALTQAGVPATLYVLPDQRRPPASRVSGYYVVARSQDQFTGGLVEFERARIATELPTEDEACRWLYGELVVREAPPRVLNQQTERQAIQQGTALAADAQAKITSGGGGSIVYTLTQGRFVDAFGQESASNLFPFGMSFAQRGLPPSARAAPARGAPVPYLRYQVAKPFQVSASISDQAQGSSGGGVRFTINTDLFTRPPGLPTIRWLLRSGYLERVNGTVVPR